MTAIRALTDAAFAPMSFSDRTEGAMIDKLRAEGDLTLSLVAVDGTDIIGHVAFSPATIDQADAAWYTLGPIAVRANRQRQGAGRALIDAGVAALTKQGAAGIVLTGNPAIYERIGFTCDGNLHHAGTPDKNVLWRVLNGQSPAGRVTFAPALDD